MIAHIVRRIIFTPRTNLPLIYFFCLSCGLWVVYPYPFKWKEAMRESYDKKLIYIVLVDELVHIFWFPLLNEAHSCAVATKIGNVLKFVITFECFGWVDKKLVTQPLAAQSGVERTERHLKNYISRGKSSSSHQKVWNPLKDAFFVRRYNQIGHCVDVSPGSFI